MTFGHLIIRQSDPSCTGVEKHMVKKLKNVMVHQDTWMLFGLFSMFSTFYWIDLHQNHDKTYLR